MKRIKGSKFPEISLGDAIGIAQAISSKNIKTEQSLATELGYSAKAHGGIFFYKWAALTKFYGLVEPSRKNITLSRLGERIVSPLSDADRIAAIRESFNRVDLFKQLYETLGANYHPADFKPKLAELTGLSPTEVASVAHRYEGIYKDAVSFIEFGDATLATASAEIVKPELVGRPTPAPSSRFTPIARGIPTIEGPVRTLHSDDGYFIQVKLDESVIEEAIAVLQALKGRVGKVK